MAGAAVIMTDVPQAGDRKSQVLRILRASCVPLDDDQIAAAAQMNRVYVNVICRQLAGEGLIVRSQGVAGKLVNTIDPDQLPDPLAATPGVRAPAVPRLRRRTVGWQAERIRELIANFSRCVAEFEASEAFTGPSLYFHVQAIDRRRKHQTVSSLLADIRFLEYVYAVLPSWGMHRMGPQAAKVGDFTDIITALSEKATVLQQLRQFRITALSPRDACDVAEAAWDVIAHIKVSTSQTQIVAGSKFLHHVLPDLVPPIDRQYTFTFFTGQKMVASDQAAFLDWFPKLAAIGMQCRGPIDDAITRRGFMATGQAKIIDNAIMGFIQGIAHPKVSN
jgi:hypothetical protein